MERAGGSIRQPVQVQRRTAWLCVSVALPAAIGLRAKIRPDVVWEVLLALAVGILAQVTLWRLAERPGRERTKR
jgi:hypothetical protein